MSWRVVVTVLGILTAGCKKSSSHVHRIPFPSTPLCSGRMFWFI